MSRSIRLIGSQEVALRKQGNPERSRTQCPMLGGRSFGRLMLVFLLALAALQVDASEGDPALADTSATDARDQVGPLDVLKIKIQNVPYSSRVNADITFRRPNTWRDFRAPNYLAVITDVEGDGKPEYVHFVIAWRKHLVGESYEWGDRDSRYCCSGIVRRLGPRRLRLKLDSYKGTFIPAPHSQKLAFVSYFQGRKRCSDGCFESVPERGWIMNDWSDPRAHLQAPWLALEGGRPQATVHYKPKDVGLAGIAKYSLLVRPFGSRRWKVADEGERGGKFKKLFRLKPGGRISLQLRAVDQQGNRSRSHIQSIRAPQNETAGEFVGLWRQRKRRGAYAGTDRVSGSPADEFTFSGLANTFCLYFTKGPEFGKATMDDGTGEHEVDMYSPEKKPYSRYCLLRYEPENRTVTVKVKEGTINVDGILLYGENSIRQ
jgi:hypothetical protein